MSNKKDDMEGYVNDIIGHLVYVDLKSWDEWYALKIWGVDFEEKSLVGEIRQVPENSVGGKYGRSEEASFVFFVPSCLEFISNEHTCRVSSLEMIQRNCLCMPALRLQLLLQQMLYVKNPNLNEYIWLNW